MSEYSREDLLRKKLDIINGRNVQNRSMKLVHKELTPPEPKFPESKDSTNKDKRQ